MTTTNPVVNEGAPPKSFIAGSAITKYRFVVLASDGEVDHVGTADTIKADGISGGDQATAGRPVDVFTDYGSIRKVEVGSGGVTVGAEVCSDNAGKAIAQTAATNDIVQGRCLRTAAAGEITSILFAPRTLAP